MTSELVPIDYATLRIIWWAALGVILIGFGVLGGADMGVGALLRLVAKRDIERRVAINAVGPTWEGNQVWLILGGGAAFAAWPPVYATAFSVFYIPMLVLLLALILRPVGFEYRNKLTDARWRDFWDWALVIGGGVPAFLFGVVFGNLLQGLPFTLDDTLRIVHQGSLLQLINPFALLCGAVSLAMVMMHGGMHLVMKTSGKVQARARTCVRWASCWLIMLFGLGAVCALFWIKGYVIAGTVDMAAPSNPLLKTVERSLGAWYTNFTRYEWLLVIPGMALVGAVGGFVCATLLRGRIGIWLTGISVAGVIGTAGVSMFPFLVPSSADPSVSLTVWDASSSKLTLFVMTIAAAIFLPIVIAYTGWVIGIMRGTVDEKYVRENADQLY